MNKIADVLKEHREGIFSLLDAIISILACIISITSNIGYIKTLSMFITIIVVAKIIIKIVCKKGE